MEKDIPTDSRRAKRQILATRCRLSIEDCQIAGNDIDNSLGTPNLVQIGERRQRHLRVGCMLKGVYGTALPEE